MPQLKLSGIFPPITTPFNHSGDIYPAKIRHNVEKWNLTNLAGYVVCGSTGESVYLTEAEKLYLWEEVAKFTPSSKLLIADTSLESVRETIHLTNLAASLGYHCALLSTPRHYQAFQDPTLYFRAVADQARIPLIIAGANASDHPNIIAILTSSNVEPLLKPGLQVLTSNAINLAGSLRAGATGAIISYAGAAPFSCLTIAEAIQRREFEAAEDWQSRITNAAALVTDRYGIPALKYAMDFNGYYGGPPRLPMIPVPRPVQIEIEAAFHGLRG